MTNLYYNTVKMLLERISSVMVDHQALKVTLLLFASPVLFCHSKLSACVFIIFSVYTFDFPLYLHTIVSTLRFVLDIFDYWLTFY
jgi:hypothetical protein